MPDMVSIMGSAGLIHLLATRVALHFPCALQVAVGERANILTSGPPKISHTRVLMKNHSGRGELSLIIYNKSGI